jgi:O-antigen/teichoic acid export membrane protein
MRVRMRDSAALGAGSALSGLLAYVFFALVTRALGAETAAPVTVLWTYWSFAAAALTFPLQHWIIHTITAHGGEAAIRSTLPRVAVVVLLVAGIGGAVAWLLRDPLFHRDDIWFPLLVAGVTVGSALVGLLRGVLAARERFLAVAWALVAENLVRCLAAAGLMIAGVTAGLAYGVSLLAGQLVGLLWPSAFRLNPDGYRPDSRAPWAGFVGGAGVGQVIAQTVLIGGPVVVALSGGSPAEVTALFAGLALFRAPHTLALGVVGQATGMLTSAVVAGRAAVLRKVRLGITVLTVLGAGVAAAVGGLAGPGLVRAVFGPDVDLEPDLSLLIAVGSAVALGNLALTVLMMAHNRAGAAVRAWVPAAALAAVVLAVAGGPATHATSWAFVTAEAIAFVALFVQGLPGRGAACLSTTGTGWGRHESRWS